MSYVRYSLASRLALTTYSRSILLKHLKRQIVSTLGGLQLIADLNAYHAFVTSLRQPQVTAYFSSLKMVGELFLIESPKDLGALVRDTTRYEGTLSPDDLYELGAFSFVRSSRSAHDANPAHGSTTASGLEQD